MNPWKGVPVSGARKRSDEEIGQWEKKGISTPTIYNLEVGSHDTLYLNNGAAFIQCSRQTYAVCGFLFLRTVANVTTAA